MQPRLLRICFISVLLLQTTFAQALTPDSDEMETAKNWVRRWFSQDALEDLPFSFTFDGMKSEQFIHNWKLEFTTPTIDSNRTVRNMILNDPAGCLQVRLILTEYSDYPAVEWILEFENIGVQNTPILEQINALNLKITNPSLTQFILHHSLGEYNSAQSYTPIEDILRPYSNVVLYPRGGRSSDGHLPFFNLEWKNQGIVFAIGWSGQWQAEFAQSDEKSITIRAGMQRTHLSLLPGEKIRTPRMLLLFWTGEEDIRGNNLFRQLLISHYLPRRNGEVVLAPICGSVNEVDPDGSYEGPHLRVMQPLAERGIEVFWSDMDPQHWYPIGFTDGTGTWEPDAAKYPHGLKPVGEAAHAAGLEYLLWFEPERVAPNTRIDKVHPEWVMKRPGEKHGLFKLNDPVARAWLLDYIDVQITAAQLDWLRYDFNIEPLEFWRLNDTMDRQGITEIRYIEGLYALWDELRLRHPGMIIDMCASGGRRNDIEALMRGIPLWHSDMQCFGPNPSAEQLQNAGLFRWIPFHGTAVFDYEPSYQFRSGMTTGNIFCHPGPDKIMQRYREQEADYLASKGIELNPWYFAGPFHKTGVHPFHHVFKPEKKINLNEKFGNGVNDWTARPEWGTAEIYRFAEKDSSAYYIYRAIHAKNDVTCPAYLGSDDGLRVWLNDQLVYEKNIDRPLSAASDFVELKLHKGDNRLLIKIANHLKRTGFYFSLYMLDQRDRIIDTAFPETEAAVKRSVSIYQQVRQLMMGDFYPLFPHDPGEAVWYGYQFHRPDLDAGMAVFFRRKDSPDEVKEIILHELDETTKYQLLDHDRGVKTIVAGNSPIGVEIQEKPGAVILFYSKILE